MNKLKGVMALFAILTILLIAKLSGAESNLSDDLEIRPVAHPQQANNLEYQAYTMEEETAFKTQSD